MSSPADMWVMKQNPRHKNTDAGGLVISSKTVRTRIQRKFVSEQDITDAISHIPLRKRVPLGSSHFVVEVSSSTIRISKKKSKIGGEKSPEWKPREPVVLWSDKSRAKMVERLATLDYSPFDIPKSLLAFITLTYPSDWLVVAPTAVASKKHLHSLRKRFEREFGRPFFAVWKMEFQRRGAPHFHLLAPVPSGMGFSEWLSDAWTDIVNHPDPVEKAKHRVAGTGVDRAKGIKSDTAQRISYYFSKHASANKGVKEYQNIPPKEWVEAGSVGRFWGYWGLKPNTQRKIVSDEHALFIARTLRRWQEANSKIVRVKVWRTDLKTGRRYRRTVRRRYRVHTGSQAFRLVPDGSMFAEQIGRFLRESPVND